MKLFLTLLLTAMLVPAGALATGSADERWGEGVYDPRDHKHDVFLSEVPVGAEKAKKGERAMGLKVDEFVGTPVAKKRTGEEIGKVKGVIVDSNNGEAVGLVMQLDDLIGVGQRTVAVDHRALDATHDDNDRLVVQVDVTLRQLRNAPAFAES